MATPSLLPEDPDMSAHLAAWLTAALALTSLAVAGPVLTVLLVAAVGVTWLTFWNTAGMGD